MLLESEIPVPVTVSDFESADVFVYQPIYNMKYDNSAWHPKNLMKLLKPECKLIKLGYFKFDGFIPDTGYVPFWYKDDNIFIESVYGIDKKCMSMNDSSNMNEIKNIIDTMTISQEDILKHFETALVSFKRKDDDSDIKMYSYFMNNYKTTHLYYDQRHPTNIFIYEMFRQLLYLIDGEVLGLVDSDNVYTSEDTAIYAEGRPLLPQVVKCLELQGVPTHMKISRQIQKKYDVYEYYFIRLSESNLQMSIGK